MNDHSCQAQALLELAQVQQRSIERLILLVNDHMARTPGSSADHKVETDGQETGKDEPKGPPIDWARLTGDDRSAAWEGLASFVEALVGRYKLQWTIRPGWWRHSDAVEELTALWQLRSKTFRAEAGAADAMSWQDAVYKSSDRLWGILSSCGEGHVSPGFSEWMPDAERMDLQLQIQRETERDQ